MLNEQVANVIILHTLYLSICFEFFNFFLHLIGPPSGLSIKRGER